VTDDLNEEEWVIKFHAALTEALPALEGVAHDEAEALLVMTPEEMLMAMQQVSIGTHPEIVAIAVRVLP
jgi:hypothetical protein